MPNGFNLLGSPTSTQSALILPAPGSSTLFYLITAPYNYSTDPLAFSIIDMTLNNGFGAVTVKNDTLLAVSTEKVTAVYNRNGTDIWIIAHGFGNNNFYSFQLTSAGINLVPVISSVGNSIIDTINAIGYLKVSPKGNQLAMANMNYGPDNSTFELFDFDDSTGAVSNALILGQTTVAQGFYGVEFSPDNSKLYVSITSPGTIVQYDLLAGSPAAIVASLDTIGISPTNFNGALQTGPDGSIYLVKATSDSLACITNPNQLGSACNYIENYIVFTSGGALGLPNFLTSYFCNIPSAVPSINQKQAISIYPNPFNTDLNVEIKILNIKDLAITIYDVLGQPVFNNHQRIAVNHYTKTIDLGFLSKGIYFLELIADGNRTAKKIVKD